jgi:hypothetical protein
MKIKVALAHWISLRIRERLASIVAPCGIILARNLEGYAERKYAPEDSAYTRLGHGGA